MTQTNKYLVPAIVSLGIMLAVLLGVVLATSNPLTAVGSVQGIEAYKATTTDSTTGDGAVSSAICKGNCIVGSIVVTQLGTAGYVQLWDATSTATSTYSTSLRTDLAMASGTPYTTMGRPIAKITGASDVGGTYQFDSTTILGLVIETSDDFDGQYIVTYKR